jgi:hypothetical protein
MMTFRFIQSLRYPNPQRPAQERLARLRERIDGLHLVEQRDEMLVGKLLHFTYQQA